MCCYLGLVSLSIHFSSTVFILVIPLYFWGERLIAGVLMSYSLVIPVPWRSNYTIVTLNSIHSYICIYRYIYNYTLVILKGEINWYLCCQIQTETVHLSSSAFMKVMNSCSKTSCGAPFIIAFHSYFSFLLFISNLLITLFPVSLQTNGVLLVHDVKLLLNSCFHDSRSSFWHADPCQLRFRSPDKSSRTVYEHWWPCVESSQALGSSF